jgi:ParB/RepB/Spo0J family partition protein
MGNEGMKSVDIKKLVPSETNHRRTFDKVALKELADSIKAQGIISPIVVRAKGTSYEIVCGERRYRAAKELGMAEVPVKVVDVDDMQAAEMQIIENIQRADVHPLDEAEGYELMMKEVKGSIEGIAQRVGKDKSYVAKRLKLCDLTPECRKKFQAGELTFATALLIARMPKDLQKKAADELSGNRWEGPMSLNEAKEHIEREYMLDLSSAAWAKDDTISSKRGSCSTCPKRTKNATMLFDDIKKGDRCTDPACFAEKKAAHLQRKIEQAKKSGREVLKTEDVYRIDGYTDDPQKGFVEIDKKCYDTANGETYKQLLAKTSLKASVVLNKAGEFCEVIKKDELIKAAKSAGVKFSKEVEENGGSDRMAEAKKTNRIREAKRSFWMERLRVIGKEQMVATIALSVFLRDLGNKASKVVQGKVDNTGYGSAWDIEALYSLSDADRREILINAVAEKIGDLNDDDLEFLADKHGTSVAKDYVITKGYLESMSKDELQALIKELGVKAEFDKEPKKDLLVTVVLKGAPKGRVPAELCPQEEKKASKKEAK